MNEGRIEQIGTPEQVFHEPANEFVMNFLGNVNVFHGRVQDGMASLGPLQLEYTDDTSPVPRAARAFIRPHDLDVDDHANGRPCFRAVVDHVNAAGPHAKVHLTAEAGWKLQAEVPLERYRELGLQPGKTVFVSAKDVRLFVDRDQAPSGADEANSNGRRPIGVSGDLDSTTHP
jgi:sulfate transport system ATP-binding protein